LKSNGAATGVSTSGDVNLIAGPREIPRVAKVPAAGGRAASLLVIKGAEIATCVAINSELISNTLANFMKTSNS
jgi:hypothetical protein